MSNMEQIIQAIRNLKADVMSFDEQGRLIIRMEKSVTQNGNELKHRPHIHLNGRRLFNNLMHPEDRIARRPLMTWMDELITSSTHLHSRNPDKLAMVYNQAALVFCLIGKVEYAKVLCKKQIDIFIQLSKKYTPLIRYIIQAWINLGRIDRILEEHEAALKKFKVLTFLTDEVKTVTIADHEINAQWLLDEINSDLATKNTLITCAFLEPIKTMLSAQRYHHIKTLLTTAIIEEESLLRGLAFEALIIACAELSCIPEAIEWAKKALNILPPQLTPLFMFRLGELYAMCNDSKAKVLFQRILAFIAYAERHTPTINHTIFATNVAKQFLHFGYPVLAIDAYKSAFNLASKIDDEPCKIKSLKGLITLGEQQYTLHYEKIRDQTGYVGLMHDNHCIITKDTVISALTHQANRLYEKLMKINFANVRSRS